MNAKNAKYLVPTADELFNQMIGRQESPSADEMHSLANLLIWGSYSDPNTFQIRYKTFWDLDSDHIRNILLTQNHLDFQTKYILFWVMDQKNKKTQFHKPIDTTADSVTQIAKRIG